ncbi:MAG: hypothetical protein V4461_11020 [Pseudomonadota bacterium]
MSHAIIVKPLSLAAVVASSTAAGHDAAYVGNDHMGVVWKSTAGGYAQGLQIDLGADTPIDTILLIGCSGARAEWQLSIALATQAQGPFTGAYYQGDTMAFLAGAAMPTSGRGKALWLAPADAPPSARYIYVSIGNVSDAAVTVARLVIGQRIQLARNFQFGAAFGVRDLGSVDFSVRGVLLRRRGAKLRSIGLTFGAVHKDEVEAIVHPLIEQVGLTEPLALVTDLDPDEQRQNRMYFGPLVGDLGTIWAKASGFEWRANLVSLNA